MHPLPGSFLPLPEATFKTWCATFQSSSLALLHGHIFSRSTSPGSLHLSGTSVRIPIEFFLPSPLSHLRYYTAFMDWGKGVFGASILLPCLPQPLNRTPTQYHFLPFLGILLFFLPLWTWFCLMPLQKNPTLPSHYPLLSEQTLSNYQCCAYIITNHQHSNKLPKDLQLLVLVSPNIY